ncbi:2Fe-2S iron-sulfur cluster-binding protein [Azospira inquinata]|jgi:Ferredoxin|uniref:(2Fe-2S)-binding protein n=1 Tax=Azospira inquinata TaxID=2785627 RepID=A0A975SPH0_9RHOO|nr:2Fe-2S iron-sulfur cluster-binding protein [Azospira inquinata]QWT47217.1 (2Fe-2S)-binding protein [Azospira inquinata]QWT50154.1 (2Fe-2S)-binding protein [Azospira inquinata]
MPNVTFISPKLKKDVTVYAVTGSRGTLLQLAKDHKLPIDFECQEGNCGSCAVQVMPLGHKPPLATHLTEKEKVALVLAGKIKKSDLADLEVKDVAPVWRLACQYMLLDEDIAVKF